MITRNEKDLCGALRAENERLKAENASLKEANEIDLGEKAPLIFENTELSARVSELTRLLWEAEEGIRRLAWKECDDCNGSGYTGWGRGKKVSCESCYGSEDSLGDGWLPNHDNIAETMNSAPVQRALQSGEGGK